MTSLRRTSLLVALGACLALAGCGGDDDEGPPIPADQAQALLRQLDNIEARLEQGSFGACEDVFQHPESPNRPAVDTILTEIPRDVDPDVRSALEDSFDTLWDLVEQECEDRKPDDKPEPEPEPETETTPTEPTPTETETTPTETETVPPTETVPTTPEEESPSQGNGGGVGPSNSSQKKEKAK